jgi:hypothetical protein
MSMGSKPTDGVRYVFVIAIDASVGTTSFTARLLSVARTQSPPGHTGAVQHQHWLPGGFKPTAANAPETVV